MITSKLQGDAVRYQKTVDVYQQGVMEKLHAGTMKLQPGQWVRTGQGPCSRWCGRTNTGSLVAVHPDGSKGVVLSRFRLLLDYWKTRKG